MGQDTNYVAVQLEEINSNVKAILEIVVPMHKEVIKISKIEEDISEMKTDIKTIKIALKETNKHVWDHEHRLTRLKTKAA